MDSIRRRRLPGLDVNPDAIRRARVAAGLSLADVAGTDLSRSAVHRVEAGKVRPSMRTLEIIADRTGKSVDAFLLPRASTELLDRRSGPTLELARLEVMIAEGRCADAAARAGELMRTTDGDGIRPRLHFWEGVARVNLLEATAALEHLRRAREAFARAGDVWMEVECLGWEAAALSIEEDRSAVDVALEALRRCRALDPAPALTESRILGHRAGIYLSLHEWERAIEAYDGALVTAGNIRNLASLVSVYDGLSIAHQGMGDLVTATAYMQRAIALSSVMSNDHVLARLENNLGLLLLRREHWVEAGQHLRKALEHCDAAGIEQGRSHVLLSLAQLAHVEKDHRRAEAYTREAIELAARSGEHMTQALGQQWLGRILAAMRRGREARHAFEMALTLLGAQGVPRRLAECHREYAEVLERQGDLEGAVRQWRQAADLWQPSVDDVIDRLGWTDRGLVGS